MDPQRSNQSPGDWRPQPLPTAGVELSPELLALAEDLARHNHDAWAQERLSTGWRYGPVRDDARKEHPCLVAYDELPEAEKAVDRNTALEVLRAVVARGYHITRSTIRERAAPPVAEYQRDHFVLGNDLSRLETALKVEAFEAAIFYSARVLEVLSEAALGSLGQESTHNVFANLQILEELGQLGTALRYWAHALRRLGNRVRHVQGPVGKRDARLAALFAESWLAWFFDRFAQTGELRALTRDGQPLWLGAPAELAGVLHSLEALEEKYRRHPPQPGTEPDVNPAVYDTPVTAAVLADIVLARSRPGNPAPLHVIERARSGFPHDLRLRQLMGLYWSREDQPARALEWLEPLLTEFPGDDETVGITAGAYKKLWRQDPTKVEHLHRSHRAYLAGWKESGRKNAYLGVNAAATALWLKRKDEAARVAADVERLLRGRADSLPSELRDKWLYSGYWPWVTLAEARLLQGDVEGADKIYDEAFAYHADRVGDIKVTREQRELILKAL